MDVDRPVEEIVKSTVKVEDMTPEMKLSKLYENTFHVTLDNQYSHPSNKFTFIGDSQSPNQDIWLKHENLDEILLQRLMITERSELESRIRPNLEQINSNHNLPCLENRQFQYLFASFKRLSNLKRHFEKIERLEQYDLTINLIINICRTMLSIFENNEELILTEKTPNNNEQQFVLNHQDNNYPLVRNNEQALNNLSIQFILLILDNFSNENASLCEIFFDKFIIGCFDEQQSIKQVFANADHIGTNDITSLEQLMAIFELDECELTFLSNIFVYLNKYFININQCDDYSNKYLQNLQIVQFLTRSKLTKFLFLFTSLLPENKMSLPNCGRLYQVETLAGKLLTPHSLPLAMPSKKDSMIPQAAPMNPLLAALQQNQAPQFAIEYRYFTNPTLLSKRDIELNDNNIWQFQGMVRKSQQAFFFEHIIRKNSSRLIRDTWLRWLGKCMFANKAKTQEWQGYMQSNMHSNNTEHLSKFSSDGFLLNLLDLLLEYSMPFCSTASCDKLLKINFNYSIAKDVNIKELDQETKIINLKEEQQQPPARLPPIEFNFITECFYLTHNCLRLSYISLYQKLMKINSELSRWQSTYRQLMESGNQNDPNMARLKTVYERMTCEFLNVKSALLEPESLSRLVKFTCSSSSWLVYLAVFADSSYETSNELEFKQLTDPSIIQKPTDTFNLGILSKIPEFFITNLVEFLIFLHRFKDSDIVDLFMNPMNRNDYSNLNAIVSLILVFMGNSDRLFNPHCRANLVEAIEIILPKKSDNNDDHYDHFNRKNLAYYVFAKHPCASYFSEALINVFVSIEMTGQSVQFEQKFNYRRPMYELLEFLWQMPDFFSLTESSDYEPILLHQHRKSIAKLAHDAKQNVNNSEQPLFLKFLNFLINDANFLLLEGLLYLEKIKTLQEKMDHEKQQETALGAQQLTPQAQQQRQQLRSEQESNLKHMIMLAKFHNFMSTKTIHTIKMMTSEIQEIFCDDVLVDRIATMLNDFLLHLVGKKRRSFKVKNLQEVEFKPKEIVAEICDIYINLGSKDSFCQAVSRDCRSYSSELFPLAQEVLNMVGKDHTYIEKFSRLGEKMNKMRQIYEIEEMNFDDAPDEFLDPIMSNLMTDPVLLPNSKTIVDRSTIARHLLSDQSDPFNRSPLSLQDVIPETELKNRIEQWKLSKLNKPSN